MQFLFLVNIHGTTCPFFIVKKKNSHVNKFIPNDSNSDSYLTLMNIQKNSAYNALSVNLTVYLRGT